MWGLTDDENALAEHVYYVTKGSIYVDSNGDLHERYVPDGERIDSQQSYAFDIFIGEIENAKLRAENDAMNL